MMKTTVTIQKFGVTLDCVGYYHEPDESVGYSGHFEIENVLTFGEVDIFELIDKFVLECIESECLHKIRHGD